MSQMLKSDKICKCVKISDKNIFVKLKNLKRLVAKTIEVIKNRPKQMESHCLFRVGFSSLIKSISKSCCLLEVITNGRSLVLFNSLVKMLARIADVPCITQVTPKVIHNALLIHKGWLV